SFRGRIAQQTRFAQPDEIDYPVAEGDSPTRSFARVEDSERQVLDRKVAVGRVGALDPAAARGVVRRVHLNGHAGKPPRGRSAPCDSGPSRRTGRAAARA